MKSELTKKIERALYGYCYEKRHFVVEEVTINSKYGIVDTLAFATKGNDRKGYTHTWYCYEIKVSKADFYSKSKVTFVGNLNYYVMPISLYDVVKHDIPEHVGVLLFGGRDVYVEKRAKICKPLVSETILMRKFIGAMAREVHKAKFILWEVK